MDQVPIQKFIIELINMHNEIINKSNFRITNFYTIIDQVKKGNLEKETFQTVAFELEPFKNEIENYFKNKDLDNKEKNLVDFLNKILSEFYDIDNEFLLKTEYLTDLLVFYWLIDQYYYRKEFESLNSKIRELTNYYKDLKNQAANKGHLIIVEDFILNLVEEVKSLEKDNPHINELIIASQFLQERLTEEILKNKSSDFVKFKETITKLLIEMILDNHKTFSELSKFNELYEDFIRKIYCLMNS